MTETATNASPDWAPSAPLAETVGQLAVVLAQSQYPSGDRAALKRWQPGQPLPLAYYRLWFHHLRREAPGPEWMPVIWALAFGGAEFHQPKRALGEALAEAGFSSARLERMLSAPEDLRLEMFQTAVRFLSAKAGAAT
ncbi:MAG: type I-E CRISPR-associated protein Cse2/CasB [Burkholderiales bacterium]|nr:type I-E CRISPR-associated protein Cse2/CasB [Burkholderiales bacterium]